jgi:hypothetical protein
MRSCLISSAIAFAAVGSGKPSGNIDLEGVRYMPAHARHRGRHRQRKPLGAKRERPVRRYSATAGVALVGASVIAITPVAPPPAPAPETRVASADVRLAAASSLLNVPINLLTDIINIPYNEVQAVDYLSRSLIFSGPWFVVSATNIWGVDPGDPGHFMATVNLLVPFPALSGLGLDQSDQTGLGQQLWHFVAAELPVSPYCDASRCPPGVPIGPITGITSVDQTLWGLALTFGLYGFAPGALVKFPLFNNWFQVPLSDLVSGYTFGPDQPGYTDPSGPVHPGFGFAGTTIGPNGENLMPWANTTFTLDLSKPFQNYFDHLMADPATNPIRLPSLEEIGRTIQTLAAALVIAFDPLTPGSGLCTSFAGNCSWLPPALDYPGIVKFISDLWPGNPLLDGPNGWLTAYDNGTANVPTKEQIETAAKLAEQNGSFWDFGNPSPPPELINGFNPGSLAPFFHQLWTNLGLNPPPLAPPATPLTELDQEDVNALTAETQLKAEVIEKDPQSTIESALGFETQLKAEVIEKDPQSTIAAAGGFETQLKAEVIEKDPQSTIAATPPAGAATPPAGAATPPAGAATPPAGAATPPAQGGGLTPRTGVNRFLPHLTGPKTPKPGTTSPTGPDPTGSLSGTASQTDNSPSLGNIPKRFLPQKPGTTNTGTTTTNTPTAPSSDAPSKAASSAGSGG